MDALPEGEGVASKNSDMDECSMNAPGTACPMIKLRDWAHDDHVDRWCLSPVGGLPDRETLGSRRVGTQGGSIAANCAGVAGKDQPRVDRGAGRANFGTADQPDCLRRLGWNGDKRESSRTRCAGSSALSQYAALVDILPAVALAPPYTCAELRGRKSPRTGYYHHFSPGARFVKGAKPESGEIPLHR